MVIGLPNTGKSTIINKLSNRNASKVADKPGQTQQQLWVNVNKNLMILDTPGVMPPTVETDEQVLWLSALHAIPERVLEIENTEGFDANKGESETIAGFVLEVHGKFPRKNEVIKFLNYSFRIESLDKKRIIKVKITIH